MKKLIVFALLALAIATVARAQQPDLVSGSAPGLVVRGRAFSVLGVDLDCFQKFGLGGPACVESDLLPEWSVVRCFTIPPPRRTDWQPQCIDVPFSTSSKGLGISFYVKKTGTYHVTARTTLGELEVRVGVRR